MAHDIQKQPDGSLMMCCGKKTCPSFREETGGGATILGDHGEEIPFNEAQLEALAYILKERIARR